jgi:hypothetical protein
MSIRCQECRTEGGRTGEGDNGPISLRAGKDSGKTKGKGDSPIFLRKIGTVPLLHRDEEGTISIISVFAVLLLAMLLGMVLNIGQQADNKVKMQSAADAASYSGGVVLTRGMNTLAFTNHLLFDVFALTAFLREGAQNHGQPMVPEILAAWQDTVEDFEEAGFTHFQNWNGQYVGGNPPFAIPKLSAAIENKVPREQQMVDAFSAWAAAFSAAVLPAMEEILDGELIPEYQRAVVAMVPNLAQLATNEIAQRHGLRPGGQLHSERGPLQGMLWNSRATPVGGPWEQQVRSLPVVDPVWDGGDAYYLSVARQQRQTFAQQYLNDWNREKLAPFLYVGGMSQYYQLWTGFTCGQLRKLLGENEFRNLPHVILTPPDVIQLATSTGGGLMSFSVDDAVKFYPDRQRNVFLDSFYTYVGAVYWPHISHSLPGLFCNPIGGDHVMYTQIMLFIPRNRLVWGTRWAPGHEGEWGIVRQQHPLHWDLLNQNWRVQIVPATHPNLLTILQRQPPFDGSGGKPWKEVKLPQVDGLQPRDLSMISHH